MHPPSQETLTLAEEQRERAVEIARRAKNDEIKSPTDVVDRWENPDSVIDWNRKEGTFPHSRGFIPPEKIVGSLGMSNRLKEHRLREVLAHLIKGDFEIQNSYPSMLQKRRSQFYVSDDGHHRCLVAKAIGLDELYVEFEEVPPELLE